MGIGLRIWWIWRQATGWMGQRAAGERGEGVISTAIAVLIMAMIGLAMWVTFDRVFNNAGSDIENNVEQIG